MESLVAKINDGTAKVAVIGAGYVGLPLAVEVAKAGFSTVAFDISKEKTEQINKGISYIGDVPSSELAPLVASKKLRGTTDPAVMAESDAIVICVPTPLRKTKDPDISMIMDAANTIVPHLKKGQLIVLESTTYPGFTREMLVDEFQQNGLVIGKDLFLAFSPERVDPGNPKFLTKNTPKVIGGITPECTKMTETLYSKFIDTLIPVTSADAAEMVKLLENTFRAVNIGLVNEVAIMCEKLRLDTWEVIDAAATKPFGFMPFYPGPGLGGHCIPIDPHYLSWKLKTLKYNARFIELAGEINSSMPELVVERVSDALNARKKPVNGSKILALGVAYKKDIDDVRESPAIDVVELLHQRGAEIEYHDPHVATMRVNQHTFKSVPLKDVEKYDCVVIITNHSSIDYIDVCKRAQLLVDTRNATKNFRKDFRDKIVSL